MFQISYLYVFSIRRYNVTKSTETNDVILFVPSFKPLAFMVLRKLKGTFCPQFPQSFKKPSLDKDKEQQNGIYFSLTHFRESKVLENTSAGLV